MENVITNFKEKFHKIEKLTKEGKSVEEINEMFSQKPLFAILFDWFLIIFIFLFVGSILIELNNQYLKRTDLGEITNDSINYDQGQGKKKNSQDKKSKKIK